MFTDPLSPKKLYLLSTILLRGFQNSIWALKSTDYGSGKFNGSDGQSKHSCLQDRVKFIGS